MTTEAGPARRSSAGKILNGFVVLAVVVCLGTLIAVAALGQPEPDSRDARVHRIAAELRCPVCQNLSAADSPAPLAAQMRRQIGEQVDQGRSEQQIRAHFVAAYGDSVLLTPPRRGLGEIAHLLPLTVLLVAAASAALLLRRWRRDAAGDVQEASARAVTDPERARLDAALTLLRQEDPR